MALLRVILFVMTAASSPTTTVTRTPFGNLADGASVDLYILKSAEVETRLATFGARIVAIETGDRDGNVADIVLGHNSTEEYLEGKDPYLGVVAGRFANRIGKGQFTLDGKQYQTTLNNGPNMLHGGTEGFSSHNWQAQEVPTGVEFT